MTKVETGALFVFLVVGETEVEEVSPTRAFFFPIPKQRGKKVSHPSRPSDDHAQPARLEESEEGADGVHTQRQEQPLVARRAQRVDFLQLLRGPSGNEGRHRAGGEGQPGRGRGRRRLAQEARGEDPDDEPDEEEGLGPGEEELDVGGGEVKGSHLLFWWLFLLFWWRKKVEEKKVGVEFFFLELAFTS